MSKSRAGAPGKPLTKILNSFSTSLLVALGACGGEEAPPEPPPQIAARTNPATAAQCPNGGSVVSAGLDRNRNQILEEYEVQSRTVICDEDPAVLVRLVAEPAGAHCAEGGTAVQSGPDRNGSGVLDAGEVEHTDYVCDVSLLTRIVAEPAGPRCAAGGVAFHIGRDLDADGALDDDEIELTEHECSAILSRDVLISTAAEAAALAQIEAINGDLVIDHYDAALLTLPNLRHINGSLTVHFNNLASTNLEELRLPQLIEVGGDLIVEHNEDLRRVELPALQRVEGALDLKSNSALLRFSLIPAGGAQTRVAGAIEVRGNNALGELVIGPDTVAAVTIRENAALTSLQLTSRHVGLLTISSNPQIAALAFEVVSLEGLVIEGSSQLGSLSVKADQIHRSVSLVSTYQLRTVELTRRSPEPGRRLFIGGALDITGPIESLLSPSRLVINGDLGLSNTRLTSLHPIHEVRGSLSLHGNLLLNQDITPFRVDAGVSISGNLALTSLAFLQLGGEANGAFISGNPELLDLGPLPSAGHLTRLILRNNAKLAGPLTFQAHDIEQELEVSENPSLVSLSFPQLRRSDGVLLINNPVLPSVGLPLLELTSYLEARDNDALRQLELPSLDHVGDLLVTRNRQLPSCQITPYCAKVSIDGACQVVSNDETTPCTP